MRIVVLGGNGRIGRPLAEDAERRGHDVLRASRSTGVDALNGAGLDAALDGADVVIDALNIDTVRRKPAIDFFSRTSQNVVAAAQRSGVAHLVVVSIWHANHPDAQGYGYYAAKAAQERVYENSGLPTTIVRSTQWYELAEMLLSAARVGPFAIAPPMLARPAAAQAAAGAIIEIAEGAPRAEGAIVAGPEQHDMADLARRIAEHRGGRPRVLSFSPPGMRPFAQGLLLPPEEVAGVGPGFDEWLEAHRG